MIDVSEYQATVNWHDVAAANVLHAYIKFGQGEPRGGVRLDGYAAANYEHARAVGIIVGLYWFADPANNPHNECERFLDRAAAAHLLRPGDIVPALDLEVAAGHSLAYLNHWKAAFFEVLDKAIGTPGCLYGDLYYLNAFTVNENRPVWVAHPHFLLNPWEKRAVFWQYGTGHVPGIKAPVDLDMIRVNLHDVPTIKTAL